PRRPQRIERGGPARIGRHAPVEQRKYVGPAAVLVRRLGERLGAEDLQRARQRVTEGNGFEPGRGPRSFEQSSTALDLGLEVLPPLTGRLKLFLGDALLLGLEVGGLDLAREPLGISVTDALAETALDVVVDHLGETAQLSLDRLGLPDQHLEYPVLRALRQHEVVAAHLGGGLELAVDAAVALLDAPRIPGQVEVKQVRTVRLE